MECIIPKPPVQYTLYSVQCTTNHITAVHCIVYNVGKQCTMYSIQCTWYTIHCTMFSKVVRFFGMGLTN